MITQDIQRNIEKIGELQEKAFGIEVTPQAFRTLISTLYSDKPGAILREISSNAIDAHTTVNNPNPFEVYLPTRFDPILKIRDFGPGLNDEFMMNKYVMAFYSSKTRDDKQIGAFGLGRLSALSLCDAYSCSSFQAGKRRNYSIYYNAQGIPAIIPLGEEDTTEPDGFLVEVPVPTDFADTFEHRARTVYRHYPNRPVIKNRDNFQIPDNDYVILSEDKSFGLLGAGHPSVAIMGTYSYPIVADSITDLDATQAKILNAGFVCHFKIGELGIQANREGLEYTPKTIEAIKAKLASIIPIIKPLVISQFEGKNIFEQSLLRYDLLSHGGKLAAINSLVKEFVYEMNVPARFEFPNCEVISFKHEYSRNAERIKKSETQAIDYERNVVLYYVESKKSHAKLKAIKFLNDPANAGKRIVFIRPLNAEAVEQFKTTYNFNLRTLPNAATLPFERPVAGDERTLNMMTFEGYYRRQSPKDRWTADDDFDETDDIVYVQREGYDIVGDRIIGFDVKTFSESIARFCTLTNRGNLTVYGLTTRQIEKKKDNWISFSDLYRKEVEAWQAAQTEKVAAYKYFKANELHYVRILDNLNINPDSLAAKVYTEYTAIKALIADLNKDMADRSAIAPSTHYQYSYNTLKQNYPLLCHLVDWARERADVQAELVEYINNKNV